jgi:hypothetical protein
MHEHRRQHWIPDTYLDAWCDPNPAHQNPRRVHRYGINGEYRDYRSPSRIFTVDELYTIPEPGGGRNLQTERALSRLEDAFARLRKTHLEKGVPLTNEGRHNLIWFVAALHNRSPAMHAHQADFHNSVVRIADDMEKSLKAMSPEQRTQWRKKAPRRVGRESIPMSAYREIAAQPFGAYLPLHIVTEAKLLERMNVAILRVPDGLFLITSDRPVCWWDPADPPPSRTPLGLGRRTIEITVPLTPRLCILITHRPGPGPDYGAISLEGANAINMRTLTRANDVFISCQPDLLVRVG